MQALNYDQSNTHHVLMGWVSVWHAAIGMSEVVLQSGAPVLVLGQGEPGEQVYVVDGHICHDEHSALQAQLS